MRFLDGLAVDDYSASLIGVNFDWAASYDEYLVLLRPSNKGWVAPLFQGSAHRIILGQKG